MEKHREGETDEVIRVVEAGFTRLEGGEWIYFEKDDDRRLVLIREFMIKVHDDRPWWYQKGWRELTDQERKDNPLPPPPKPPPPKLSWWKRWKLRRKLPKMQAQS
jgi:hypothetical protein